MKDPNDMLPSELLEMFAHPKSTLPEMPFKMTSALWYLRMGEVPMALHLLDAYDEADCPVGARHVADYCDDQSAYFDGIDQIISELKGACL